MRKNIPKDTNTFHYHDANPKGKKTGDCVIRALSYAFSKTWDEVLDDLVTYAHKYKQMTNSPELYSKYVKDTGYVKVPQPVHCDGKKYTGAEFCGAISTMNLTHPVICHIGAHHLTVISTLNGRYKVFDTWNCSEDKVGKVYMHPDDVAVWSKKCLL